jgi:hypothetical protein
MLVTSHGYTFILFWLVESAANRPVDPDAPTTNFGSHASKGAVSSGYTRPGFFEKSCEPLRLDAGS